MCPDLRGLSLFWVRAGNAGMASSWHVVEFLTMSTVSFCELQARGT